MRAFASFIVEGTAQDGALELESAELRFETAAEGQPTEVTGKAEVPMMAVVAEMMIFANSAVARRIHQAFPSSALLRRHPPPRQDAFKEVHPFIAPLNFSVVHRFVETFVLPNLHEDWMIQSPQTIPWRQSSVALHATEPHQ